MRLLQLKMINNLSKKNCSTKVNIEYIELVNKNAKEFLENKKNARSVN